MARVTFNDWRENNKRRKYPFSDGVPASNNNTVIPDNLFFDGRLYPIGGNQDMYLNRITKTSSDITFAIRATGTDELATATVGLSDIPENGEVAFFDSNGRAAGLLMSDPDVLQAFSGIDVGSYSFFLSQTQFAAAVVVAQPETCVRGIVLESGEVMSGEVWLVGEDGIVLRNEDGAIRVDIIGDPFASRKLCEDSILTDDDEISVLVPYCPIKTINGIEPDEKGNFELLVGDSGSLTSILRITPGDKSGNTVAEHFAGASVSQFATLTIELLGQIR